MSTRRFCLIVVQSLKVPLCCAIIIGKQTSVLDTDNVFFELVVVSVTHRLVT